MLQLFFSLLESDVSEWQLEVNCLFVNSNLSSSCKTNDVFQFYLILVDLLYWLRSEGEAIAWLACGCTVYWYSRHQTLIDGTLMKINLTECQLFIIWPGLPGSYRVRRAKRNHPNTQHFQSSSSPQKIVSLPLNNNELIFWYKWNLTNLPSDSFYEPRSFMFNSILYYLGKLLAYYNAIIICRRREGRIKERIFWHLLMLHFLQAMNQSSKDMLPSKRFHGIES